MDDPRIVLLTTMHEVMASDQKLNNAGLVSQFLVKLLTEYDTPFHQVEILLRKMNSRIYLVGLPLAFYGDQHKYKIGLPTSDKQLDYALWVEVNGKDALQKVIDAATEQFGSVDRTLKETGLLTVG